MKKYGQGTNYLTEAALDLGQIDLVVLSPEALKGEIFSDTFETFRKNTQKNYIIAGAEELGNGLVSIPANLG